MFKIQVTRFQHSHQLQTGKRLSEKQKQEIVKYFIDGFKIDEISQKFDFTKLTISRNLKKSLGDQRFLELNSLNIKGANFDKKKTTSLKQLLIPKF